MALSPWRNLLANSLLRSMNRWITPIWHLLDRLPKPYPFDRILEPGSAQETPRASGRSARLRSDAILQLLERRDLRRLRGRTRLEHGRLARERIRALARLPRLHVFPAHLMKPGRIVTASPLRTLFVWGVGSSQ